MATLKGSQLLYSKAFDKFHSKITKKTLSMIDDHLGSEQVLHDFDTDNVYDIIDRKYIECTDNPEESLAYLENPVEKFTAYSEELTEKLTKHL